MNLLIVTPVLGALTETFITNHILNLPNTKTFVITSRIDNPLPNIKVLGIPLKYGPATFDQNTKNLVANFISENKITHILIEFANYGSEIIELNFTDHKLPIFVHFHGYDASQAISNNILVEYYKILPKYVNGFITVSYAMTKRLIEIGLPPEKFNVNTYGTPFVDVIKSNPDDKIRLLFVGRLVNKKNPLVLLQAVHKLLEKNSNIIFNIIGDGPLKPLLENYIYTNKLESNIFLLGSQPHSTVNEYFSNTDIYIQNSCIDQQTGDREGTPVSIIEAMSYGLPIISTKHEGINEIIINFFNGILVDENDLIGFYKYLDILIQDKFLRKYLGQNAKTIHNTRFNSDFTNKKLVNILMTSNTEKINKPFFSICIPTYNRASYLRDAIKSVFLQNFDDYEIIVVDDGSTDKTREIISSFPDKRLKYIYKNHTNAPDTRNIAIQNAKGDYLVWLDSDDILLPNTLVNYYKNLALNPNINLIYGDLIVTDSNLLPQKELNYIDWSNKNNLLLSNLFNGNYIPNPAVCIHKDVYDAFGGYNIAFTRAHDYEFWTRIAKFVKIKKINHKTCLWRWHSNNLSAETKQIDTSFEAKIVHNMLENYSLEELFIDLDWKNKSDALTQAYLAITKRFIILKDYNNALKYAQKAYEISPIENIKKLIENIKSVDIL